MYTTEFTEVPLRDFLTCVQSLKHQGIRFVQIKNYLAFYVVKESQVTVIRFLYAKSDWISILKSGFPLV